MDKINKLLELHAKGDLDKDELNSLVYLLVQKLNINATTIEFTGEQLMTVKAENALLKQKLWNKRAS